MTVSKTASKIYKAAKKAAKGVWSWRLEWSRAMKMAWKEVAGRLKNEAIVKAIYDFSYGYKKQERKINTFPSAPVTPRRDDVIDLQGLSEQETSAAISSIKDKGLVIKITADFIVPEVAGLANLEGIVYGGTSLWESRQTLKMICNLKYVDCQNVGEEDIWDAETALPGVRFR